MYKAVIFDFFDVIHDDSFKKWLRLHGLKQSGGFEESSQMVDRGHISEHEFYQRLAALSGQSLESVQNVFGDTQFIDTDLVKLIETLRNRYKIGLLSNSSSEYLRPILEDHVIAHLFDTIVISAEVGLIKPSEEVFQYILKQMEVGPQQTIFIDDNPGNVAAATKLGIRSIVYTGKTDLEHKLAEIFKN